MNEWAWRTFVLVGGDNAIFSFLVVFDVLCDMEKWIFLKKKWKVLLLLLLLKITELIQTNL
jgi:hypothetical protein